MASTQENNKRIAKNTFFLYIRMSATMAVSLYTSRIVLQVLGVSDYGLYNVIGGILTMFAMFSAALNVGTQRFLTFAMGENDDDKLKRTFSLALGLHVALSIFILLLAETFGLWFLETQMNIPEGRETAAFWVYQFTVIGFLLTLCQVPFQSCLIAHEEMNMYAYMSIYDVVMKLLIVFLIQFMSFDKLILYGLLILMVNVTSILIYNIYCQRRYEECTFKVRWDSQLAKEIAVYSGWNLFGGSLGFLTNQGVNILLNIFCGTAVNAARGLSMTVNTAVVGFVNNFQTAVNPQIVKLYAAGELEKLFKLIINNGRVAVYLFLLIAIPAFIEIDFVLHLWLGEYPEYTAIFVQLILIQSANQTANQPIGMLLHAIAKLKYPTITTVLLMMVFPVSYVLLKMGYSPISVYVASCCIWLFQNVGDLFWAHRYSGISVKKVLRDIYFNVYVGAIVMFSLPWLVSTQMEEGWGRLLTVGSISVIWSSIIIYFWGLTPGMRSLVNDKALQLKNKILTHE